MGGMGQGDDKPSGTGSPMFCDHANEVPGSFCVCPEWCYCWQNTCKSQALGAALAPKRPKPPAGPLHVRLTETGRMSYAGPVGQVPRAGTITDEEFDEHVAATEKREDGTVGGLDYCLLKLNAEAGEVAGLRGKEILLRNSGDHASVVARRAAYALELGDVLWYLHEACRLLGLTVDQVKRLNIMKLRRRRELFPGGGLRYGKHPSGELHDAIAILSEPPTAETRPVECMRVHSYAEGCPLVCGTPTKCGEVGCQRAQADEFQPCVFCYDLTRYRDHVMLPSPVGGALRRPLCKAPACRKRQALGDSVPA